VASPFYKVASEKPTSTRHWPVQKFPYFALYAAVSDAAKTVIPKGVDGRYVRGLRWLEKKMGGLQVVLYK